MKNIIGMVCSNSGETSYSIVFSDGNIDHVDYDEKFITYLLALPSSEEFLRCRTTIMNSKTMIVLQDLNYIYGFECK